MPSLTDKLIEIADMLADKYLSSIPAALIPSVDDLTAALSVLVPSLVRITPDSKVSPTILGRIEKAVRRIQSHAGGLLEVDGILGERTIRWLQSVKRCAGNLAKSEPDQPVPSPETRDPRKIRYWFESLPDLPGADPELLLEAAWVSWVRLIKLDVRRAKRKSGANVLITTTAIDGAFGTLAVT